MEIQQGNLIGRIYKLSTKCPFNFLHEAVHDFYHVDWDDMPFYYHSDHLGSAAWITGAAGSLVQYIMHAPYGEQLLYQHASWYDERFTFTGKERDTETGYTHYDARYLLPALSFWGSVDPLVDKYIYNSGYVYCGGYPIKFVDPNGMDIFRYDKETGDITLYKKTDDSYDLFGKFKYNRKTGEYELRTNKDGSIKTYKDHLGKNDKMAKGILRDGLNIKQDGSSFISDDNAGPTISDYFNFALILDEVAGVEVSGYVLEAPGEKNRKIVLFEPYKGNALDRSINRKMDVTPYNVLLHFHTHGHAGSRQMATTPSEEFDIPFKNDMIQRYPCIQLFILHNYGMPIQYH